MGVSFNWGCPVAGWFISWTLPFFHRWFLWGTTLLGNFHMMLVKHFFATHIWWRIRTSVPPVNPWWALGDGYNEIAPTWMAGTWSVLGGYCKYTVSYGGFHKWGYPQMDGLWRKIPVEWMIWGYPISGNLLMFMDMLQRHLVHYSTLISCSMAMYHM